MGNRSSKARVENQPKDAKRQLRERILLLGPRDSGKSTVLKQIRMGVGDEFTAAEVEFYRRLVFNNIIRGVVTLVDALSTLQLHLLPANERFIEALRVINDLRDGETYPQELLKPLQDLWGDPSAQQGWSSSQVTLPENLQYFFKDLPRVFQQDYLPTTQDIMQCRAPTSGIIDTVFKVGERELNTVESGSLISWRQWIHLFRDVTMIIFTVSLNGYDQCLFEDASTNRMQDAMDTWVSICQSEYFRSTSFVLLFTKSDLFSEKVKKSPIRSHFPDYEGPEGDADEGREYFCQRFLKLSSQTPQQSATSGKRSSPQKRQIYAHYTNPTTDTNLFKFIMSALDDTLLRHHLYELELLD